MGRSGFNKLFATIKILGGALRAQRRKTFISKVFQANVHSPLFIDRKTTLHLFSFDISELIKPIFRN
uniref:Protein TIC 214 n=1 Tax=Solanum lycopersicum TaxID=4081 RepID=A0A3Q7EVG5_SOLLC